MKSTSEALSGIIQVTWQGTANGLDSEFTNGSSFDLDLGVGAGWGCWVSGVRGDLLQFAWVAVQQQGGNEVAGVKAGDWYLEVKPLEGRTLSGSAVCAPTTTSVTIDNSTFPDGVNQMSVVTNGSFDNFCGLSRVGAFATDEWTSPSDHVTVSNNGTNPDNILGSKTWTLSQDFGSPAATCSTAPLKDLFSWNIAGPSSGVSTRALPAMPAGTVCFLGSVTGEFQDNSFTDGVSVQTDFKGNWTVTAAAGKSGVATCVD